jgi:DNA-binding transcriptional LysR family regulator
MSDQLNGIAAFVQAAQAASFALAAEQMGLSRSAVGKAVARLEQRLGVQLFHRTTRSLKLTDEGVLFYERCAGALADIKAAEQLFDSGRREPVGRLRISVPVLLGRHCVTPLLVRLARTHARLEIDAVFTDRPVDLLDDGFDLVVRTGALANETDLRARRLGTQTMALCATSSSMTRRTRIGRWRPSGHTAYTSKPGPRSAGSSSTSRPDANRLAISHEGSQARPAPSTAAAAIDSRSSKRSRPLALMFRAWPASLNSQGTTRSPLP